MDELRELIQTQFAQQAKLLSDLRCDVKLLHSFTAEAGGAPVEARTATSMSRRVPEKPRDPDALENEASEVADEPGQSKENRTSMHSEAKSWDATMQSSFEEHQLKAREMSMNPTGALSAHCVKWQGDLLEDHPS
eukprot:symbB.v1.2.028458.t1/scaffold3020.1/size65267/1